MRNKNTYIGNELKFDDNKILEYKKGKTHLQNSHFMKMTLRCKVTELVSDQPWNHQGMLFEISADPK